MKVLIDECFEVEKIPQTTHQSGTRYDPRSHRTYKSKQLIEVENMYKRLFKPYIPEVPAEGEVRVKMVFLYKTAKRLRLLPRLARPDLDNMAKTVLDVMTQLKFWNDDSQVGVLILKKANSDKNEIQIKAVEI